MRVLIIKLSSLAEILNALPVLDFLKQANAEVEIDWVVEDECREILEGNPLLSQLYPVQVDFWRSHPLSPRTWREVSRLKETLLARKYDLVFDLHGDLASGIIGRFTGATDRLGFEKAALREPMNAMFSTRKIPLRRQDYHQTDRALRQASVPFAKNFQQMQLSSTVVTGKEDDADAVALLATLSDGLVFVFHYGADLPTALWSANNWTALGRAVLDHFSDSSILFTWEDETERAAVSEIAREIGGGARVIDRLSIKGLASLLKRVDLVVGGDTAPVQLAAAVGTPTVSFYRAGDAKENGPRGEQHVVVQSPMHCTRCFRRHCDKDAQCRETIKPETIFAGVRKVLEGPA